MRKKINEEIIRNNQIATDRQRNKQTEIANTITCVYIYIYIYLQSTNYTATCHLAQKLSKLDETCMQDTAGEAGTMYSYGSPHMAEQKQDDQLEHTYSSNVRIQDVVLKTYQRR